MFIFQQISCSLGHSTKYNSETEIERKLLSMLKMFRPVCIHPHTAENRAPVKSNAIMQTVNKADFAAHLTSTKRPYDTVNVLSQSVAKQLSFETHLDLALIFERFCSGSIHRVHNLRPKVSKRMHPDVQEK